MAAAPAMSCRHAPYSLACAQNGTDHVDVEHVVQCLRLDILYAPPGGPGKTGVVDQCRHGAELAGSSLEQFHDILLV
jgi:hypothetical protein